MRITKEVDFFRKENIIVYITLEEGVVDKEKNIMRKRLLRKAGQFVLQQVWL